MNIENIQDRKWGGGIWFNFDLLILTCLLIHWKLIQQSNLRSDYQGTITEFENRLYANHYSECLTHWLIIVTSLCIRHHCPNLLIWKTKAQRNYIEVQDHSLQIPKLEVKSVSLGFKIDVLKPMWNTASRPTGGEKSIPGKPLHLLI